MYLIEDVVEIDDIDDIDEIDGIDGKRPKSDGQETFETIFSTILYLFFFCIGNSIFCSLKLFNQFCHCFYINNILP